MPHPNAPITVPAVLGTKRCAICGEVIPTVCTGTHTPVQAAAVADAQHDSQCERRQGAYSCYCLKRYWDGMEQQA